MKKKFKWTNASVLNFAEGADPVAVMESRARELVLGAIDEGWSGPPFDPLELARWLDIPTEARGDIPDARTVPHGDGLLRLEYNPMRPRGRLRFSIAHEIAHSLFADCADEIRHRDGVSATAADNWQLEVLCNIGAAELLMPLGSFSELAGEELSIQSVAELRRRFDVSVEACLIRLTKLARQPCAAFCASLHEDGQYRLDYVIPAPGWASPAFPGQAVSPDSAILEANAIGYTAIGRERWGGKHPMRVECIGLAPYPGAVVPRVVGLLISETAEDYHAPEITDLSGDALSPRGKGPKIVAHIVPDVGAPWGGKGFAAQVRRRFPAVWQQYKAELTVKGRPPKLGETFVADLGDDVTIVHMVAQKGIGPSVQQRLRYAALAKCLGTVGGLAKDLGASVHMPRIGTGHGGASWPLVKELVTEQLVEEGVAVTVYSLPRAG